MTTKQLNVTDRILLRGVDIEIPDDYIRSELLKTYQGVKHVQRWYRKDENETPKDLVQVNFTSPKYTERFLQDGCINIGSLRCQVAPLKPTMRLENEIKSDNDSDHQSEIFTEEQQVTDKILVHDVPTHIPDEDLKQELSKIYRDIRYVKRWYYKDESKAPTERVQIDFTSSKYTKTILENGFISAGRYCWPVTALKPSMYLRNKLESDSRSYYQPQILTEQDILYTFEEQKKRLNDLMCHFDDQLNKTVRLLCENAHDSASG